MFYNYLLIKIITHYNIQNFQKNNQQIKLLITKIINITTNTNFKNIPYSTFSKTNKQTIIIIIFQQILKTQIIIINTILISKHFIQFFKKYILS